ncbi:hypothetical protein WAB15_01710 [Streptomyces sirii]|uniref:Integral membrane protein n=1 Tax=Streptomyces sirii TaxID=3127701 RepID=A0ABZ2QF89_9ACTN
MTTGPVLRLARAAIFAAVCVVTTALGHVLMSGDTLPVWAVAYALAATTAGAWWLTGRERGALVVTGSTMAAQFALHTSFSLSQSLVAHTSSAPATTSGGTGGMAGIPGSDMAGPMHHAAHAMSSVFDSMGTTATGHTWSLGMGLAHGLAALVCGLWLWRGEAAVFRLARSLAAFVFAPLRRARRSLAYAGPASSVRPVAAFGPVQRLRTRPLRYAVLRRGPPARPVCC